MERIHDAANQVVDEFVVKNLLEASNSAKRANLPEFQVTRIRKNEIVSELNSWIWFTTRGNTELYDTYKAEIIEGEICVRGIPMK
jgi:hypothetical protein